MCVFVAAFSKISHWSTDKDCIELINSLRKSFPQYDDDEDDDDDDNKMYSIELVLGGLTAIVVVVVETFVQRRSVR